MRRRRQLDVRPLHGDAEAAEATRCAPFGPAVPAAFDPEEDRVGSTFALFKDSALTPLRAARAPPFAGPATGLSWLAFLVGCDLVALAAAAVAFVPDPEDAADGVLLLEAKELAAPIARDKMDWRLGFVDGRDGAEAFADGSDGKGNGDFFDGRVLALLTLLSREALCRSIVEPCGSCGGGEAETDERFAPECPLLLADGVVEPPSALCK